MYFSDSSTEYDTFEIHPAYSYTELGCEWSLSDKASSKTRQKLLVRNIHLSSLPDRTMALANQLKEICCNPPNMIVIIKPSKFHDKKLDKMSFKELTFLCGLILQKLKPNHLHIPTIEEW